MLIKLPFIITLKDLTSNLRYLFARAEVSYDLLQSKVNYWCDDSNGTLLFITLLTEDATNKLLRNLKPKPFWWNIPNEEGCRVSYEQYTSMEDKDHGTALLCRP